MTIKQARKILGILAKDISDDQLEKEIETAAMLKNLFFIYNNKESINNSYTK